VAERLVVVKVGGSLITDKSRPLTVRRGELEKVASRLAGLRGGWGLVVVHGGGSFGHFTVKRLEGGPKPLLVSEVRYWMSVLSLEFVRALMDKGAPAVSIPPMPVARYSGGVLAGVDAGIFKRLLALGVVPVTHGDVVLDDRGEAAILSGDVLACELALALGAGALVFLMPVEGVYSSDPARDPGARLLRVVTPETLGEMPDGVAGVDVTGGIRLKLREALRAAGRGVRVAMGGVESLEDMVLGREGLYTRVLPG